MTVPLPIFLPHLAVEAPWSAGGDEVLFVSS